MEQLDAARDDLLDDNDELVWTSERRQGGGEEAEAQTAPAQRMAVGTFL